MNDLAEKIRCINFHKLHKDGIGSVPAKSLAIICLEHAAQVVEEYSPWTPADTPPEEDGMYIVEIKGDSENYSEAAMWEGIWQPLSTYGDYVTGMADERFGRGAILKWMPIPTPPKEAE